MVNAHLQREVQTQDSLALIDAGISRVGLCVCAGCSKFAPAMTKARGRRLCPSCSSLGRAPQPFSQAVVMAASAEPPPALSPIAPQPLPDLDEVMTSAVRVLESVPRGARRTLSKIVTSTLTRCTLAGADNHAWELLLVLPRLILAKPRGGERVGDVVLRRCAWWQARRYGDLWQEALLSVSMPESATEHRPLDTDGIPLAAQQDLGAAGLDQGPPPAAKKRSELLARQGLYRHALASLFSSPCVPATEASSAELQALHPDEPELASVAQPPLHVPAVRFRPSVVRRTLKSFRRGSSAGISLLSARHLNELIAQHNSDGLTVALASFVSSIVRGAVPLGVRRWMFGARLVGIAKRGGGTRPIASGETLRRLAAKLLCASVKGTARNFFLSRGQVGVAVRCGAEGLIKAARMVVERGDTLVKVDFANAFNSAYRAALYRAVVASFPQLAPYFWAAYGTHSALVFGCRHQVREWGAAR